MTDPEAEQARRVGWTPEHHERQAIEHLAALERDPDTYAAEFRLGLAQAHAALALTLRVGLAQARTTGAIEVDPSSPPRPPSDRPRRRFP